jgi:hypothetical protein
MLEQRVAMYTAHCEPCGSGIYPFEMMNSTTHYFVKIVNGNNFVLFIHTL